MKRMGTYRGVALVIALILMLGFLFSSPLQATPLDTTLFLQINGTQIQDNAAGDLSNDVGVILFSNSLGTFNVTVTTGTSKPVLPTSPYHIQMDLNTVNISSLGPGSLTIKLTDTAFQLTTPDGSPNAYAKMTIGGTTTGDVDYSAYLGDGAFDRTTLIGELGTFSATQRGFNTAFSGSTGWIGLDVPEIFSLTQVFTIKHYVAGATSFNAAIDVVTPEPGTLMLLGSGLVAMGLFARRRKK